jgi:hypothetical protein
MNWFARLDTMPGQEMTELAKAADPLFEAGRQHVYFTKQALRNPGSVQAAINDLGPEESTRIMTEDILGTTTTSASIQNLYLAARGPKGVAPGDAPPTRTGTVTEEPGSPNAVAGDLPGSSGGVPVPSQAEIDAMLARLPARSAGDKTSGTLVMDNGGQVDLKSGVQGPGEFMPKGFGFVEKQGTASHVEGHAAAAMRLSGSSEANLFINNTPCLGRFGCAAQLPNMLPEGARLNVFGPQGYMQSFSGVPDPQPFPLRLPVWTPNPNGTFLMDDSHSGPH